MPNLRNPLSLFASKPATAIQTRSVDLPEKVFIEREGRNWEYSEIEPAGINRFWDLINGYYSRQNFIELFYCVPEVFAPVHEIASRVADANWQLKKTWNDEVDYNDADFNRLFLRPNPLLAMRNFVYQAVCYEILTGRQFWSLNKPDTLPDEFRSILSWYNLPAQDVKVEMKKTDPYSATELEDFIKEYTIPDGYGGTRRFNVKNVIPLWQLDLKKGYDLNSAKPLIIGAEKPIRNLIPVYEARGIIYIKRGALGFLVSKNKDVSGTIPLTPAERKELESEHNKNYGITNGRNPVGISSANVEFVRTAMSIAELEPFSETLADAMAIYAVLKVPGHLVPSKDRSTFNNADADMKSFYQDVIIPWAKRYAEIWTTWFKLSDLRRYIFPDYSHIDLLQENKKEKSEIDKAYGDIWLQRWEHGVCSLNEWIVHNDGMKGIGPIYEKKIFEMTPEESEQVKQIMSKKPKAEMEAEAKAKSNGAVQVRNYILEKKRKYDPNQPRDPGGEGGGQWVEVEYDDNVTVDDIWPNATIEYVNKDYPEDEDDAKAKRALLGCGLPEDFKGDVKIYWAMGDNPGEPETWVNGVHIEGDGFFMDRSFKEELDQKTGRWGWACENEYFQITENSPYKGRGADIFNAQVKSLTKQQFNHIYVEAAGGKGGPLFNGYYTWARLGYIPDEETNAMYDAITEFEQDNGVSVKGFHEIMATEIGQNWWKKNGVSWSGKFDLTPGSKSHQILKNYMNGRKRKKAA